MYEADFTDEFLRLAKKLKKKNPAMLKRIEKKIEEILENPEHYKPLKKKLKGKRRVQAGSFVLVFEVKGKTVEFKSFTHHNHAY